MVRVKIPNQKSQILRSQCTVQNHLNSCSIVGTYDSKVKVVCPHAVFELLGVGVIVYSGWLIFILRIALHPATKLLGLLLQVDIWT